MPDLAMDIVKKIILLTGLVLSFAALAQDPVPVEIVVEGKQPGPPMWRVKNGDNTLYIFAWLSPIPDKIFWESRRVEEVISEAQEYIMMPDADISVSPLVMLNPINIVRGMSLGKRVTRNEDKAELSEVLPPELYSRFVALKQRYFPRNKKIEKMRPLIAGAQMERIIQKEAGLVPADDVGKRIRRLVKRNRDITETEILYERRLEGGFKEGRKKTWRKCSTGPIPGHRAISRNSSSFHSPGMLDGGFRDLASRVETLVDSFPRELELSCFERQLSRMEEDLEEMQYRANTWAQGYIQEFKFIPLPGDADDDCTQLIATSSEQDIYEDITSTLKQEWLTAAEKALASNTVTFAVLDFSELLLKDGLVAKLKDRGYEVLEP